MEKVKKYVFPVFLLVAIVFFGLSSVVFSHCEIPCGIYHDGMRIDMMSEDIETIEKAMNQIHELSAAEPRNYNQLVRWITNKDKHADSLSDSATEYFMKQRLVSVESAEGKAYQDYIKKLTLLHKLMVYSMKCKQTTDLDNVTKLKDYLGQFKSAYMPSDHPVAEKTQP